MSLPDGWTQARLSEVCSKIVDGSHNPPKATDSGFPMLSARNIQGRRINFDDFRFINEGDFSNEHARTNIQAGDVLLTIVGTIGRTAVVAEGIQPFVLQRSVAVLKPQEINPRYLSYLLESPMLQRYFQENAKGTAQKGIYLKALAEVEISLAPLNEQKRIADKLDTLLARVDACSERLDRVPQVLKRFRQAVLAAVTSGVLTEKWREKQKIKAASAKTLSKVVTLKTGPFGSALHREDYVENGVPVINPMHINNGRIAPTSNISISALKAEELKEFRLKTGDVIIARRGVMGRCAVVTEVEDNWVCGTGSMVLRSTKDLVPAYLQICLSSPDVVATLEHQSVGSTMINLNQRVLLALEILIPSISEQHEIVRRVEILFAFADHFETHYTAARVQINQLIPSLFDKAFCGELVPQDPNDEPAEKLLEWIRTSKKSELIKPKRKASGRKPMTMKITIETVKMTIQKMPQDHFSFEELRNALPGNYESLKDAVFEILSESKILRQFFDPVTQSIRFKRSLP